MGRTSGLASRLVLSLAEYLTAPAAEPWRRRGPPRVPSVVESNLRRTALAGLVPLRTFAIMMLFIPVWGAAGMALGTALSLGALVMRYGGPVVYQTLVERPSIRSDAIPLLVGTTVVSLIVFVLVFRAATRFLRGRDGFHGSVGSRGRPSSGSLTARSGWKVPWIMVGGVWALGGASLSFSAGMDLLGRVMEEPSLLHGVWQGHLGRGDPTVILASLPLLIVGILAAVPVAGRLWQRIAATWFHLSDEEIQAFIRIERR